MTCRPPRAANDRNIAAQSGCGSRPKAKACPLLAGKYLRSIHRICTGLRALSSVALLIADLVPLLVGLREEYQPRRLAAITPSCSKQCVPDPASMGFASQSAQRFCDMFGRRLAVLLAGRQGRHEDL